MLSSFMVEVVRVGMTTNAEPIKGSFGPIEYYTAETMIAKLADNPNVISAKIRLATDDESQSIKPKPVETHVVPQSLYKTTDVCKKNKSVKKGKK